MKRTYLQSSWTKVIHKCYTESMLTRIYTCDDCGKVERFENEPPGGALTSPFVSILQFEFCEKCVTVLLKDKLGKQGIGDALWEKKNRSLLDSLIAKTQSKI